MCANLARTILINNPGFYDDNKKWWEPDWAKNGSYFVLRKMGQDVPKFHKYVTATVTWRTLRMGMT